MISDRNCIQIYYGLTLIRVYYIEKEFYINLVDLEKIHPAIFKKAHKARDFLVNVLKNESNIDVRFFYSTATPTDKKIKILDCSGYYSELDVLYKCLLLLID